MRCNRGIAATLLMAFMATGLFFVAGKESAEGRAPAPRSRVPRGKSILQGKIVLKGDAPNVEALTKQLRKAIENFRDEGVKDHCLNGDEFEKSQQVYRLGGPKNKQVGNVFVWIAPAEGGFFPIDDKQLEEAKKHEVVLRQPHGAFIPHCAVLFTQYHYDPENPRKRKSTGQVLKIVNDAPFTHNVNWRGGAKNPGANVTIASEKNYIVDNLTPELTPISFRCNIHAWMSAYVRVFDHPYATVSRAEPAVKKEDKNFGTYEIKYVPAGKARVFAWHEKAGWLNEGAAKGEPIELRDGAITVKNFELGVPKEDQ